MFLHYLGKHQDEPQKLCIFSHAAYYVLNMTLLWLAVSSTCINYFLPCSISGLDNNLYAGHMHMLTATITAVPKCFV